MSAVLTPVARNPLVPELLPDISRLTPAELAAATATGRALHLAKIAPYRLDFTAWQSAEPVGWLTSTPSDEVCAQVGLGADLGWYQFGVAGVILTDLVPDGVNALTDNYITDGSDRWVVLAHDLESEDLTNGGGILPDPILLSFSFVDGIALVPPSSGIAMQGTGSYSRWLCRASEVLYWTLETSCPTVADIQAAQPSQDVFLDYFYWRTAPGGKLEFITKDDRTCFIRILRSEADPDLLLRLRQAAWWAIVSPSFVEVLLRAPKFPGGAPRGFRVTGAPSWLCKNGAQPSMKIGRGHDHHLQIDHLPGLPGTYEISSGGIIELVDVGQDRDGVQVFSFPSIVGLE